VNRLASSIHAIYRPLARSRRDNLPNVRGAKGHKLSGLSDVEDEPVHEEPIISEEEPEEDFEPMRQDGAKYEARKSLHLSIPPLPELDMSTREAIPTHPPRSGSMATVKLKRRTKLAEKLKEIFELDEIQEVITGI
jgi:sterol 3beta-glucosyltransferase